MVVLVQHKINQTFNHGKRCQTVWGIYSCQKMNYRNKPDSNWVSDLKRPENQHNHKNIWFNKLLNNQVKNLCQQQQQNMWK